MSGNHAHIARWRRQQSLGRTWQRRPDLLDEAALSKADRKLLEAYRAELAAAEAAVAPGQGGAGSVSSDDPAPVKGPGPGRSA